MTNFQSVAGSVLWAGMAALLLLLTCTPVEIGGQNAIPASQSAIHA